MNKGMNWKKELAEQSSEDWLLGGTGLACIAEIPEEERELYLPKGELQNIGEEKMDCASRAPLNVLETKFNWLIKNKKLSFENEFWLKTNDYINNGVEFSDAFVAINSGTTRQGNSLKAPLEAIRKQGLIPKNKLPQLKTWAEHHDPARITEDIKKLGLEFISRFFINYERGHEKNFNNILKNDIIIVGGYAWPPPISGEYPAVNYDPNHAFIVYKRPKYYVFDNYLDENKEGDFIKKLAPDYNFFDTGYRILINNETVIPKKKLFNKIKSWLGNYFNEILR